MEDPCLMGGIRSDAVKVSPDPGGLFISKHFVTC